MSFEAKEKKAKNCSEFKIIAPFMRIDSLTIKLVDNCGRSCWTSFTIDTANSTPAQPAFPCSKLTIETLKQGVKYVQS